MLPLPGLLSGSTSIDAYMARAQALKSEKQVYMTEVKHLVSVLDQTLRWHSTGGFRRKVPGSTFSHSEVAQTVTTLRSVLLAAELMKRAHTGEQTSDDLKRRARSHMLRAIRAL